MRILVFSVMFILLSCNTANESSELENKSNSEDSAINSQSFPEQHTSINDLTYDQSDDNNTNDVTRWENGVRFFIHDKDTLPTNVRENPSGNIILKLPKSDDYEVWLIGESSGWFKVKSIEAINEEKNYEDVGGYIHGSILAATTTNYGGETVNLYYESNEKSGIFERMNKEFILTLVSANEDGSWFKIKYRNKGKTKEAWIKGKWLCGSLRTNCS